MTIPFVTRVEVSQVREFASHDVTLYVSRCMIQMYDSKASEA